MKYLFMLLLLLCAFTSCNKSEPEPTYTIISKNSYVVRASELTLNKACNCYPYVINDNALLDSDFILATSNGEPEWGYSKQGHSVIFHFIEKKDYIVVLTIKRLDK